MATSVPRSLTAAMFEKVKATKAANLISEREEDQRRRACPIEQAKNYLRQRGWIVFNARVLPGFSKATLDIMVGNMQLTPQAVVEMAERLKRARAA